MGPPTPPFFELTEFSAPDWVELSPARSVPTRNPGVVIVFVLGVLVASTSGPVAVALVATAALGYWWATRERPERNRVHTHLVDRARMFSWEIDSRTGRIVTMNGNVAAVLGYEPTELEGADASVIVDVHRARSVLLAEGGLEADTERHSIVTARHKHGHTVTLREVRLTPRRCGIVRGVSVDITEFADALRFKAEHDVMTGLVNREMAEAGTAEALERLDGGRVALFVADLDRFKGVNDTLGHPVGDRLLRKLAERLRQHDSFDVIARLGGDEFAVVASGVEDDAHAMLLGRRVHELLSSPVTMDGMQLAVGASIGIAISPGHGTAYADLMKHADMALYRAKRAGGGVKLFEPSMEPAGPNQQLLCEIVGAFDRGEFELHFQPQVDLRDGRVVGAEGLIRWRHPELGLLAPGQFFGAIDVGGHYHRMTEIVLRQAVAFAARLRAERCEVPVAVNLRSMSFLDQQLPETVRDLLETHELPGSLLTIEVTESDILDEGGRDAPVFRELAGLGIRMSIDDFGTGYSNFTRLRALDVDEVKVDRAFVQGLGQASEDEIIVRTTIQLAQLLGLAVVAEGVETAEQLRELRALGCTIAQGFFWSPAVHPNEFMELLTADTATGLAA